MSCRANEFMIWKMVSFEAGLNTLSDGIDSS